MLMSVGGYVGQSVHPPVVDRTNDLHADWSLGKKKTPIDSGFTRSKVKVKWSTFVYLETYL